MKSIAVTVFALATGCASVANNQLHSPDTYRVEVAIDCSHGDLQLTEKVTNLGATPIMVPGDKLPWAQGSGGVFFALSTWGEEVSIKENWLQGSIYPVQMVNLAPGETISKVMLISEVFRGDTRDLSKNANLFWRQRNPIRPSSSFGGILPLDSATCKN